MPRPNGAKAHLSPIPTKTLHNDPTIHVIYKKSFLTDDSTVTFRATEKPVSVPTFSADAALAPSTSCIEECVVQ